MATIYRKTDKGQAEIETRQYRLPPRLRTPLIMVDGRRTDDDLRKVIGGGHDEVLASLLEQGFIEAIAELAAAPASPAPAPTVAQPARAPSSAPSTNLDDIRRLAVRLLIDQLGPGGEATAIRIERTRSLAELRPLLDAAHQLIKGTRGSAAADSFAAAFPSHFTGSSR